MNNSPVPPFFDWHNGRLPGGFEMIINLSIQFMSGPNAGAIMTFMCLGIANYLYRMDEMKAIPFVHVIGYEVLA